MSDQTTPININTAEREELMTLPRVGPAIADRIIGGRPFTSIEDLQRINGISSNFVEHIQTMIIVNDDGLQTAMPARELPMEIAAPETQEPVAESLAPESAPVAGQQTQEEAQSPAMDEYTEAQPETTSTPEVSPPEAGQQTQEAAQPPATGEDAEAQSAQQAPASAQPRLVTLSQALWMSIGSGVLALVLALAIGLGVLMTFNGGLQYVSPADLNALGRKVDGVTTQAQTLQQDLNGLRDRVNNLQGLSGRVTNVEGQAKQLRTDLDATSQQVGQINQQMTQVSGDIKALQNQTSQFQGFLDGLKSLLNQVTQP